MGRGEIDKFIVAPRSIDLFRLTGCERKYSEGGRSVKASWFRTIPMLLALIFACLAFAPIGVTGPGTGDEHPWDADNGNGDGGENTSDSTGGDGDEPLTSIEIPLGGAFLGTPMWISGPFGYGTMWFGLSFGSSSTNQASSKGDTGNGSVPVSTASSAK